MGKKSNKRLFYLSLLFLLALYSTFIYKSLAPRLPEPGAPPLLYSRGELTKTFIEAIHGAKTSIHLVMFGLTDPKILYQLKKKSDSHIPTKIFYDPSASATQDLAMLEAFPITGKGLMHQKILIVDEERVFLGSANMTTPSLNMHDNLLVGIYSPKLAHFLIEKGPLSSGYLKTTIGGQQVEVWLLPDKHNYALHAILNLFFHAGKTIKIAMFTLTHPLLIEGIAQAAKRGVDVTLLLDKNASYSSKSALEALQKEKVKILYGTGPQLLHHKFLYIDDQTLLCGSANWTKAAFHQNHDSFIILHNVTQDQKKFMKHLWDSLWWTSQEK